MKKKTVAWTLTTTKKIMRIFKKRVNEFTLNITQKKNILRLSCRQRIFLKINEFLSHESLQFVESLIISI